MDEHSHFEVLPRELIRGRASQRGMGASAVFFVGFGGDNSRLRNGSGKRSARGDSSERSNEFASVHSLSSPKVLRHSICKKLKRRTIAPFPGEQATGRQILGAQVTIKN